MRGKISKNYDILFFFGIIIIEFMWWQFFFPSIGFDSSQWALSALIQSLSAVLGILIVVYVFIDSNKRESIENLAKLEPKYHNMLISPTKNGTPFILKLREEFLENILQDKFDSKKKLNPYTHSETDYLEEFYSVSVLAEYMTVTYSLDYPIQKIRNDLESIGYFKTRSEKLFRLMFIARPLMNAEFFFSHLLNLPMFFNFEGELRSKIQVISHDSGLVDNIPKIRFELIKRKASIGEKLIFLSSFIIFNIIGELFALSITTAKSFDYINVKILTGVFVSSGLIAYCLIFYYMYGIIEKEMDTEKFEKSLCKI